MARYIENLNACTDPVSGDYLWIVDASAGATDKDRRVDVGAFGLLATAQTWTAQQTFSGGINAHNGIRTTQVTIADDAIVDLAATYGAPVEGLIFYQIGNAQGYAGIASIRAAATPYCQLLVQVGSTTSVGTTALTAGTSDGTDGNVNIAATSDGNVIVKNRTGGSKRFTFLIVG